MATMSSTMPPTSSTGPVTGAGTPASSAVARMTMPWTMPQMEATYAARVTKSMGQPDAARACFSTVIAVPFLVTGTPRGGRPRLSSL